ncbi:hypothetical protein D9M68_800570 [compost metagenome]
MRADCHGYALVDDAEAMGQVFDFVDVGDGDGDFIALLHRELVDAIAGRHRYHVNPDLVAVTDNLVIGLQVDAVFLGQFHGFGEVGVVSVPNLLGANLITASHGAVVRLCVGWTVVHKFHFIAGDIDQLIVLWMQRANR